MSPLLKSAIKFGVFCLICFAVFIFLASLFSCSAQRSFPTRNELAKIEVDSLPEYYEMPIKHRDKLFIIWSNYDYIYAVENGVVIPIKNLDHRIAFYGNYLILRRQFNYCNSK